MQAWSRRGVEEMEVALVDAIDLQVPDLATLHKRRSEKWSGHEPEVLPSTVAEMDFRWLLEAAAALHAAIDRHDLGYTPPTATSSRRHSPDSPYAGWVGRSIKIKSR